MSDKKEATGYEKFFIKTWEDWDGDQSVLSFYKCELDSVFAVLAGVKEADVVDISNEDCVVRLYNFGDAEPFFVQPFKLTLVESTNGESNN